MGSDSYLGEKGTSSVGVEVSQVLYAGGRIAAAIDAAECLARAEEWQKEVALDTLVFDAKRAYYDWVLARALVRVAEDSVVTFKRHLEDAQHAFDVGMIGAFEVLRAKTELGARESDVIAAENAERLAVVNLRRLLAVPQDTALAFEEKLGWIDVDTPVDALVTEALANRAELRALEKAAEAANADIRRLKGEYLPSVAATAEWMGTDGLGALYPDGLTVTVGAEWTLFAGGKRKHSVAAAKAELERIEYQQDELQRLIELDVRQAHIQLRDAIATIRRENGTVELGLEGRRLAMLRFHEGVGTQAEALDAELALAKAETSLVQALRDYAVAHAALDKALGRETVSRNKEAGAK